MKKILALFIATLAVNSLQAREIMTANSGGHSHDPSGGGHVMAGCTPSTAKTDLDINNVRTLIFINGDMWWDLVGTATYEIPKGSGKHSLFAGAIWCGGLDHNSGALKVAAQLYRQSGSTFWPGPLTLGTSPTPASVTPDVCSKFDKHFKITRDQVLDFIAHSSDATYEIPDLIKSWPGNGDDATYGAGGDYSHFLAPYYDVDGNADYNPDGGDFPGYYLGPITTPNTDPCSKDILLGDQTLWWVFNDEGNTHQEPTGPQIGLEIQAQAFAFATNDEINNMTFYRYKLINRTPNTQLDSCYMAQFVDPDLGNYLDDYVGCDVKRGFGYCYNGDDNDEGAAGYGLHPPAIGIDFFQGPIADIGNHKDDDRDSCVDCTNYVTKAGVLVQVPDSNKVGIKDHPGDSLIGFYVDGTDTVDVREQIIMSKFVWFNNNSTPSGNPFSAQDYYNYMKGIWKDGKYMTYGGDGRGGGNGATTDSCDFMFPGSSLTLDARTSDPNGWGLQYGGNSHNDIGVPWDEKSSGNLPYDRRFVQSCGPFTLKPGAVNYITDGAVWARTVSGGALASIPLVRSADDYAQALFDNCFRIVNGPDAPDVSIREMNQEIILSLTNDDKLRNNLHETYSEKDPNYPSSAFHFEGYQVFQLRDQTVSSTDVSDPQSNYGPNPAKARLVAECDIKNGLKSIVNYYIDPVTSVVNGYALVAGNDNGLQHTFRITTDLFATGDNTLVNHKTYYYMVVAYAYNAAEEPTGLPNNRNKPYLSGRNNIKVYSAIPHIITPEEGGLVLNTDYGDGPEITRQQGAGDGYQAGSDRKTLDLREDDQYNALFSSPYRIGAMTYQKARGPVDIRVFDPIAVVGGDFELKEITPQDTVIAADTTGHDTIVSKFLNTNTNDTNYVVVDSLWMLKNLTAGQPNDTSFKSIKTPYDQVFQNYGFSINMAQTVQPGVDLTGTAGLIEATQTFNNPKHPWLTGVQDADGTFLDWIGSNNPAFFYEDGKTQDKGKVWQNLLGGTWTCYRFTQYNANTDTFNNAPGLNAATQALVKMANLTSVDLVITSDRSKWSKVAVIELQQKSNHAINGARFLELRRSLSLDINFNPIPGDTGYSYFPGYAVDVETGERLNIAFGEDSYLSPANGLPGSTGADMQWNPTSEITSVKNGNTYYTLGGKHVIYIFARTSKSTAQPALDGFPAYDGCKQIHDTLHSANYSIDRKAWITCIWVGYPLLTKGETMDLSNTVKYRFRVTKPYRAYAVGSTTDSLPDYTFSTWSMVAKTGDLSTAKSALDLINVVPNPYYAYSQYEKNQIDNRVKITNLPSKCTISIYTPSGTLVRQIRRDVAGDNTSGATLPDVNGETSVDWNLKNQKNIPVSSGLYLIHVDAPGIGEKTIKFFGVLRPIDLDSF